MDIESKTSIYEEKEETQEVNPEEQKSEIKSEKEKDRVLQTAVIVAVAILVIGGITVARRLSNPCLLYTSIFKPIRIVPITIALLNLQHTFLDILLSFTYIKHKLLLMLFIPQCNLFYTFDNHPFFRTKNSKSHYLLQICR